MYNNGTRMGIKSVAGFYPLLVEGLDESKVSALVCCHMYAAFFFGARVAWMLRMCCKAWCS